MKCYSKVKSKMYCKEYNRHRDKQLAFFLLFLLKFCYINVTKLKLKLSIIPFSSINYGNIYCNSHYHLTINFVVSLPAVPSPCGACPSRPCSCPYSLNCSGGGQVGVDPGYGSGNRSGNGRQ